MSYLVTIAVGIFGVSLFPALPSLALYTLVVMGLGALCWILAQWRPVTLDTVTRMITGHGLCLALGMGWGIACGQHLLAHQLPDSLDKQLFLVQGSVVGLVDHQADRKRFKLAVQSISKVDTRGAKTTTIQPPALKQLLLSWYLNRPELTDTPRRQIHSGDHWQLMVRLRRPRGMLNPGGFDYQAWLVQQGYSATGYVVESALNGPAELESHPITCALRDAISHLREQIREAIGHSQLSAVGQAVIIALTIGDKQGLSPWWDDLVRWGIVHLLVISGLHIGLVASLGFAMGLLIVRFLLVFFYLLPNRVDCEQLSRWLAPIFGFLGALAYSAIAGFALPTQRAMIAVAVVMLAKLTYRKLPVQVVFVWSLLLIAVTEPLAVLSASFWLSFCAVATLLLWFSPWLSRRSQWRRLVSAQLALLGGLAAVGILFMGHLSWLGPVVNLIAVPWVSLVTVPLCLLGMVMFLLQSRLADSLWLIADWSVNALWSLLQCLPTASGLVYLPLPVTALSLACIAFAAWSLFIPRGISGRWLCALPLLLALLVPSHRPALRLTVLDVGQGLSIVIELPDRVMVYDTGPAYSKQFDAGSGVVAPFLRSHGRSSIDKLLISHEDDDHAGGFYGLADSIEIKQALVGPGFLSEYQATDQTPNKPIENIQQCDQSQHWSWLYWNSQGKTYEPIYFDILMPDRELSSVLSANNSSCVLMIHWRDQRILLTGDIEKEIEQVLLERYLWPPITLMIAPHHGSKTSSSRTFVEQLKPQHAVFSAGYRHQYRHPHQTVVNRYREVGSQLWNTAQHGAITFTWHSDKQLEVTHTRSIGGKYWWR